MASVPLKTSDVKSAARLPKDLRQTLDRALQRSIELESEREGREHHGQENRDLWKQVLIPQHMLLDNRVRPPDLAVFAAIASFADMGAGARGTKCCWPSVAAIQARSVGYSRSSVLRAIDRLDAWGYLRRERRSGGRGRTTMYKLVSI